MLKRCYLKSCYLKSFIVKEDFPVHNLISKGCKRNNIVLTELCLSSFLWVLLLTSCLMNPKIRRVILIYCFVVLQHFRCCLINIDFQNLQQDKLLSEDVRTKNRVWRYWKFNTLKGTIWMQDALTLEQFSCHFDPFL